MDTDLPSLRPPWRPRELLLASTLGLAALASCAHPTGTAKKAEHPEKSPFVCPAHGGVPWRELTSDHFVLSTDLDRDRAQHLLHELELMYSAVVDEVTRSFSLPAMPGRIGVFALRNDEEFREFVGEGFGAIYFTGYDGHSTILLPGDLDYAQRIAIAHELTHHVSSFVFPRQPYWFQEGLASYLESLGERQLDGKLAFGTAPASKAQGYWEHRVSVRELFTWNQRKADEGYYGTSWLLIHYLINNHPKEFQSFEKRLEAAEPPDTAWRSTFPQYDPETPGALEVLDGKLLEYARRGEYQYEKRELRVTVSPKERPLSAPEVHGLRLSMPRSRAWTQPELRAELAETLAEDPGHPLALQRRAQLDRSPASSAASQAVRLHPNDWQAWIFQGIALDRSPVQRERAFRRALELAPESPQALLMLASTLSFAGRNSEAYPLARKASQLAPRWSPAQFTLVSISSATNRCQEAALHRERGLELLDEETPPEFRSLVRSIIEENRRRCP